MNKNINKLIKIFVLIILFFSTESAFAMNIYFEQNDVEQESGLILVKVFIDSEKKEINVVDGTIKIDGDFKLEKIDTDKSIFNLWPEEPSVNDGTITFVGGTASSVYGSKIRLFDIWIKPKKSGDILISAENTKVFLSDGVGTQVDLTSINKNLKIENDEIVNKFDWFKTVISVIILLVIILFMLFLKNKKRNEKKLFNL